MSAAAVPDLRVVPDVVAPLISPRAARTGLVGWLVLVAGIAAYDAWAIATRHETLSTAFRRAGDRPPVRSLEVGALAALAWHLLIERTQP